MVDPQGSSRESAAPRPTRWPFPFPEGTQPFRSRVRYASVEALAEASRPWQVEFRQMSAPRRETLVRHAFTGRILLSSHVYGGGLHVRGSAPAGGCIVSLPIPGRAPAYDRGRPVESGFVAVDRPGSEFALHTAGPIRVLAATVEAELFDEAIGAYFGAVPTLWGGRRFRLRPPLDAAAVERRMRAALDAGPGPAAPGARRGAARDEDDRLLETMLESIEPYRPERPDPGRRGVARRLEALLRERLRDPVTVLGLCKELGVPMRTVEQGFREAFGTSPRSYLALLRLNAARAALAASGAGDSIGEIAFRCGLRHPGRFSVAYRRLFGESPRATQRQIAPSPARAAPAR